MYRARHAGRAPYARLRAAIFLFIATGWPAARLIRTVWSPRWGADLSDAGALATLAAAVSGRLLWHVSYVRLGDQVEYLRERVDDWDRAAALLSLRPALRVIRSGRRLGAPALRFRGDLPQVQLDKPEPGNPGLGLHAPQLHDNRVVPVLGDKRGKAGLFIVKADAEDVLDGADG